MSQQKEYESAFTVEKVEALECAIAEGVLRVKYSDKEVTYRSLSEMRQILNTMKKKLGLTKSCASQKGLFGGKRVVAKTSNGLGDC